MQFDIVIAVDIAGHDIRELSLDVGLEKLLGEAKILFLN